MRIKKKKNSFFFVVVHFWMQTPWFRIYSLHHSCGTNLGCCNPNMPFLTKHERILPFCFSFASPLLFLWLFFSPFVMPGLVPSRNRTMLGSGERGWHSTYNTWCSWGSRIGLITYRRGWHCCGVLSWKNRRQTKGREGGGGGERGLRMRMRSLIWRAKETLI